MTFPDLMTAAQLNGHTTTPRNAWTFFRWAGVAIYTFCSSLDGKGPQGLLEIYLLFIFWDFVTGVIASVILHRTKSSVALIGIGKKVMGLAAVGFAHSMDMFLNLHTGGSAGLAQSTITRMMIGYEFVSICENVAVGGIILPRQLKDVIARITAPPASTGLPGLAQSGAPSSPEVPAARPSDAIDKERTDA